MTPEDRPDNADRNTAAQSLRPQTLIEARIA